MREAGILLFTLVALYAGFLTARRYAHMLQLESYYLGQCGRHFAYRAWWLIGLAAVGAGLGLLFFIVGAFWLLPLPALFSLLAVKITRPVRNVRKPLQYTARLKRLLGVYLFFMGAITLLAGFYAPYLLGLPMPLAPLVLYAAAALCKPLEKGIAALYVQDAKRILKARPDLKIIGITGSFGKTSVKFILSTLLSERYPVLTPPGSYNTTMGVVRVIREQLQRDDQLFICEMGARHKGDIAEICRFVKPDMALITSIGPAHLEIFGSMEAIRDAKFELIQGLKPGGESIVNANNEYAEELYHRCPPPKLRLQDGFARAEGVVAGPGGSAFTLVLGTQRRATRTLLLGAHNIQNILLCALAAYRLGLTIEEICRGIERLEPVEHRLQIVATTPYTILDDAFNSSPDGAKAALEVLQGFPGRHIVLTPGFVETDLAHYHRELGRQLAAAANEVVLILPARTGDIALGLREAGFPEEHIHLADSLQEATAHMHRLIKPGDTALFLNDLPDNF